MKEHRFIKRRAAKIVFLCISTLIYTFLSGVRMEMALDEVLVLFFIDIVFLAAFVYFLEEERLSERLPLRETNDFLWIAFVYVLGMAAAWLCSYLPEYSTLSLAFAGAMTLASNRETALTAGVFLNLMTAMMQNQEVHVLTAAMLLTILGVMLAPAEKKKRLHLWVQFLVFSGTIVIIISCYYFQYLLIRKEIIALTVAVSAANLLLMELAGRVVSKKVKNAYEEPYQKILKKDYPLVGLIRKFSEIDYNHAVKVSKICGECAKVLGLDEDLCRAGGFYYRIGRMEGEPCIENGVILAENACFPEKLIQILKEYNGELFGISTRESAIVHMVDRVVAKLDLFDKETFSTNWNQDMVIYQTLNEESATGIYDGSGLSMNQFLTIRDFLVKGEGLFDSDH